MIGSAVQPSLFAATMPPSLNARQLPLPGSPASRRARAPGTLRLCNLGSGSGGNCTVVTWRGRAMLLDAGFGPRTTERRLKQAKLDLDAVDAICLTHLDHDHFRPTWLATLLDRRIRVFVHRWHADTFLRRRHPRKEDTANVVGRDLLHAGLLEAFDDTFEPLPGLSAGAVRLQHDRQGTIGYRLQTACGRAIGYATDLGHVPAALIAHFRGVSLLCLECNYDERMTICSPRPSHVNRRNMSDSGHLSNEQSFAAVQAICALTPGHLPGVLLMHRSQQCNHPRKVRRVFERDPLIYKRVTLTEQRRRTRWFEAKPVPTCVQAQLAL